MKHQIIESPADVQAMLRCVAGVYVPPFSYRLFYSVFAVAGVSGVAYVAAKVFVWSPESKDDRLASLVAVVVWIVVGWTFVVRATTSYLFSQRTIERRGPLPWMRRSMCVEEIREGWLHLDRGAALELRANDDSTLIIPLEAQLRADLAKLYPEIGTDSELTTPVLPSRYRKLVWLAVALIVIGVVVMAFALTRSGLTAWQSPAV